MANKTIFESKCEKFGKPQPKDKMQSNENWNVFPCGRTCECGGKFAMYVNGQKMG